MEKALFVNLTPQFAIVEWQFINETYSLTSSRKLMKKTVLIIISRKKEREAILTFDNQMDTSDLVDISKNSKSKRKKQQFLQMFR